MDHDATWYGGRPRSRRQMGIQIPLTRGTALPIGPCLLWPNGWMDQDCTWYGDRPQSGPHCIRCGPSSPASERGTAHSSPFIFSAHVYFGQTSPISATGERLWRYFSDTEALGACFRFWATVCKTVRPMLSDGCPVCDVGVLWLTG